MQFSALNVLLTSLLATSSLAFTLPTSETPGFDIDSQTSALQDAGLEKRIEPCGALTNINKCGKCNGSSCKIGIINFACQIGKCTVQSGGGDGVGCGIVFQSAGTVQCPGTR
ncbi:hypothetical protein B0J14DRAFT_662884 [Halenospora varia]|nr:hypothetical protein B0J14DRAFT_662884 [Halenospora varia]